MKAKLSISISEDLDDWLIKQVEIKRFANKSHGIEVAVELLKRTIEAGKDAFPNDI